jgi:lipoate-protein ligase B
MLCIAVPPSIINNQVTDACNCFAVWQGCVSYSEALSLQMLICELKRHGFEEDVLLLLEHPPTITLGRSAKRNNLLTNEDFLKSRGIGLWNVDRGGDITFHGPGQLVGYPILSLRSRERDVHGYMRNLEESLIRLLAGYGIEGFRESRYTGVWTQKGKIAAMGVHISRWITRHGFALNVNTDLSYYDLIVPCGIEGREVASMKKHLMEDSDMDRIAESYISEFGAVFNRDMIRIGAADLRNKLRQLPEKFEDSDKSSPIIHSIG